MRIVVINQHNPNIFTSTHQIAAALADQGADVHFLSTVEPADTGLSAANVAWTQIPRSTGLMARVPWFRSNSHRIVRFLRKTKPDWIVAQHEYGVPMLIYKALTRREVRCATYFVDYHGDRKYVAALKQLAKLIDAYVDICDVRLKWRQAAWPQMRAIPFVIRQAPQRRSTAHHAAHDGPIRVAFTNSRYIFGLNHDRLSRFLTQLCVRGIAVDWYLPGPEEARTMARSFSDHPLYSVRGPVEKSRLLQTLDQYDVGLHWAPMAEADYDPDYFHSAASNKIGEYIAAGLVVAHAGNPGLSYLPAEICAVFDPTNPEAGADQLAAALSDRVAVERKRAASFRYHLEEMNFESQARPFIHHVMARSFDHTVAAEKR